MIVFCPACQSEQMVTAVMLQCAQGTVACCQCSTDFNPRAHRLTPKRERAFKAKYKQQQLEREAVSAEPAVTVTENVPRHKPDQPLAGELPAIPVTTGDEVKESAKVELPVNRKAVADVTKQGRMPVSANAGGLDRRETDTQETDTQETDTQETIARLRKKLRDIQQRNAIESGAKRKTANRAKLQVARLPKRQEQSQTEQNELTQQVARQRIALAREQLKLEQERLRLERSKLELEAEKLRICREHITRQTAGELERPVIEYNTISDLLPPTPNAIHRGGERKVYRPVKLELAPLESVPIGMKPVELKTLAATNKNSRRTRR